MNGAYCLDCDRIKIPHTLVRLEPGCIADLRVVFDDLNRPYIKGTVTGMGRVHPATGNDHVGDAVFVTGSIQASSWRAIRVQTSAQQALAATASSVNMNASTSTEQKAATSITMAARVGLATIWADFASSKHISADDISFFVSTSAAHETRAHRLLTLHSRGQAVPVASLAQSSYMWSHLFKLDVRRFNDDAGTMKGWSIGDVNIPWENAVILSAEVNDHTGRSLAWPVLLLPQRRGY